MLRIYRGGGGGGVGVYYVYAAMFGMQLTTKLNQFAASVVYTSVCRLIVNQFIQLQWTQSG